MMVKLREAEHASLLVSSVDERHVVAEFLYVVLSNTVTLAMSTQHAHWNVTGENFVALHEMFEKQYNQLNASCDDLAERVRQLGFWVDGSMPGYLEAAQLEPIREPLAADAFVRQLLADHRSLSTSIAGHLDQLEQGGADRVSIDLLQARLAEHEQAAWFLASHLVD